MSRTVDWVEWRARSAGMAYEAARLSRRLSGIRRDGQPGRARTPEDDVIITRMVLVEVERRRADGRLVKLGPREYELRPRLAKTGSAHSSAWPSAS